MKIKTLLLVVLLAASLPAGAQVTWKWTPVPMDSTWDDIRDLRATQTIARYSAQIEPLMEIVGYSDEEYTKHRPESGLSNFAVDVIREVAAEKTGRTVDVALTNFGGIRTSLPKGAVRVYDIFSIFPFDNYLVAFDIKGSDLRQFLTRMVERNRIEALSGVRIEIADRKPVKLEVAGEPIDDDRTYTFATSNFLMTGGDGISLSDVAFNRDDTGVWIRDAIVDYLRAQFARGERIVLNPDGRIKYVDTEEK